MGTAVKRSPCSGAKCRSDLMRVHKLYEKESFVENKRSEIRFAKRGRQVPKSHLFHLVAFAWRQRVIIITHSSTRRKLITKMRCSGRQRSSVDQATMVSHCAFESRLT